MVTLNNADILSLYRLLILGREMETALSKASGVWHPDTGEEAVVVGTFFNLRKEDIIAPHYRGSLIAYAMRGIPVRNLFAGVLGKETSHTRGRIISKCGPIEVNAVGWLHENVGPQIYLGTGAALAAKLEGTDRVAVVIFGDGTSNRGEFHEAINMAAILKLPAIYVCQNNQYSISLPASRGLGCRSVADRAIGYGIPGVEVDGNDVLAVHEAVQEAVKIAREGKGPSLIEAKTYRVGPHYMADPEEYRSGDKEEIEKWKKRDPVDVLERRLMDSGILAEDEMKKIRKTTQEEVSQAMKQAEIDPFPREELLGIGDIFCPASEGRLG